ncbi:two-component system chemotaxis sensor kinase CheA [Cryobacterium sp. MP_M5]|uniref:hybrid sensor histidine kinase/response regulator n=1 Tax=unclassified Cryobacterium TaxID=2649013 RepID=UPI0018CBE6A3|nr:MULTISPECIES: response regulator [unclassified Cryobacterium]MBG6058936.1 two-component system chemotaxis sensor kinase CheA [Cryobacterium sp. MP_M3]MEC5177055.1 two-component system chemotaxis sensor kinase CheA [Cryobacterium sp. MP_M5]
MSILDIDQIRMLFGQEAGVRLAELDRLLLQLEQQGGDETLIRSIFRELHTLKGSAAVAGLDDVSQLAHELEELVVGIRSGIVAVTPAIIDTLLAGADRLGSAIAGEAADVPGEEPVVAVMVIDESATPVTVVAASPRAPTGVETASAAEPGGVVMVPMDRLDELVRLIGESASAHLRMGSMLMERFGVDPTLNSEFNELSRTLNELQERAMRTRMVPLATITDKLQRAVRDLARAQGKTIRWEVRGADTELDRGMLVALSDSLLHLVRNAVDHGIEPDAVRAAAGKPVGGTIRLHAMQLGSEVIVAITDDGNGIDTLRVRAQAEGQGVDTSRLSEEDVLQLIFRAGLSTTTFVTDLSGRGVGLDVVRSTVEAAHGRVEVRSEPGRGTEFRVIVPITLAVLRCLLVEAGGQRFALPFHRVVLSQRFDESGPTSAEGRTVIWVEDQPVPVSALAGTLGICGGSTDGPIVVLADTARRHGFQVDRLVGQRDVVIKGLSTLLPHLPAVAGASVEPDGSILLVLDPPGLIQRARQAARVLAAAGPPAAEPSNARHAAATAEWSNAGSDGASTGLIPAGSPGAAQRILVVDDALTIRELQRSILERAGFEVRVAVDGLDALAKLSEGPSELILTDIEMPLMDGFALTEAVRAAPDLTNIPVLILSSRSSEADRQRGLEAGADGFILKSGFDEGSLLLAVNRLIGARR